MARFKATDRIFKWWSLLIPSERLRHWLIAFVAAILLGGIIQLFEEIDWGLWLIQTHLFHQPASGQIVFAGVDGDMAVPDSPAARIKLADALDALGRAGAKHIFVDLRLDKPSAPTADARLASAIARLGNRVSLVERRDPTQPASSLDRSPPLYHVTPGLASRTDVVVAVHPVWYFGYVWNAYFAEGTGGDAKPSLAAAMTYQRNSRMDEFPIDYAIDLKSIPRLDGIGGVATDAGSLGNIRNGNSGGVPVSGKTILISRADPQSSGISRIPGHFFAPESYIDIYAAETLVRHRGIPLPWWLPFVGVAAVIVVGSALRNNQRARHIVYVVAIIAPVAAFLLGAQAHVQTTLSPSLALLAIYGFQRWLGNRRARLQLVDPLTGMGTMSALVRDIGDAEHCAGTAVVVARILNFDDVLSALPDHLHVQYALAIAERLRVADPKLKIYKASTGLYGWTVPVQAQSIIEDHLKGLRAIFARPLLIDGRMIDTAITFGVDSTNEPNPATKLASASSAAHKANEAHQPVRHSPAQAPAARQWEVSMHAALDSAMARDEMYTVYQPQFCLNTGALLGAEALARWNDPVRGEISPAYFIEQCEQAGRMEALTRFILDQALTARAAMAKTLGPVSVSVNVSATLLADDTMPRMLRQVLADKRHAAENIIFEVTETSRIADFRQAEAALTTLRGMGARISIDDFGVDAGNFLNLLRLPCDELKIDRVFVAKLREIERAGHIIASLVHFGRRAGVSIIAEGIEDGATLAMLRDLGCHAGQGYFLARPMRIDLLLRYLAETGAMRRAAIG